MAAPLKIAYVIPQQVTEHNLEVLHSANAWWMDRSKVHELLSAFKYRFTIQEACVYTGITLAQYKYFARLHPIINELREDYKHMLNFKARQAIFRELSTNGRLAMRYLEKAEPEEWGSPSRKRAAEVRADRRTMKEAVARDREEYSK